MVDDTDVVLKQPMIDLKRPMYPKAADVIAKSGRCPLRTKAVDVGKFSLSTVPLKVLISKFP